MKVKQTTTGLFLLLCMAVGLMAGCDKNIASTPENTGLLASKSVMQIDPAMEDGTFVGTVEKGSGNTLLLTVQIANGTLTRLTVTDEQGDVNPLNFGYFGTTFDLMDAVNTYLDLVEEYPCVLLIEIENPTAQADGQPTKYAIIASDSEWGGCWYD